ncbi:MAG: AbrB family transcriptional regulator [Hyphomicrobiales bacterium]|nr:AbrB family transcriptional regulator [Hyphomicrobiales bacterium]
MKDLGAGETAPPPVPSPPPKPSFSDIFERTAFALIIGAAGGALFHAAGLPAAWLTGSMLAVAALALFHAPMELPGPLASASFVLVGVSMGAGFDAQILAGLTKWPLSLVALFLSVPAIMGAVAFYLRRAGWDAPTAFFASIPGALSYVIAMSLQSRADARLVVMAQMVRLMILMAILPPLIVALTGEAEIPVAAMAPARFEGAAGFAVMIAGGAALGLLLHWLRAPAGLLLGAMIASATLHLTGLVAGQLPGAILVPTLVVLGAYTGMRFEGASVAALVRSLPALLIAFFVALGVAALFAAAVAEGLGVPWGQALLAFAPGGLEAMIILSFLLGLDPAYVGAHQFARFLFIALLLPVVARRYLAPADRATLP